MTGLDRPAGLLPGQRRAAARVAQRDIRGLLLEVGPRQVRHQVVKLTQRLRRIDLVQALIELLGVSRPAARCSRKAAAVRSRSASEARIFGSLAMACS